MTEPNVNKLLQNKRDKLHEWGRNNPRVGVALSGGQDSVYLLAEMADANVSVLALTAVSPFIPKNDFEYAEALCRRLNVRHVLVSVDPLADSRIRRNGADRCYHCKKRLFESLLAALEAYWPDGVLVEGSHVGDLSDIRPGRKALQELRVISPLLCCGYTKADIARGLGLLELTEFIRPASACLATRVAFDQSLEATDLKRIDAAENMLRQTGVSQVRVRLYGNDARIEVLPAEFALITSQADAIIAAFQQLNFASVSLDLRGYRTGSWNETIDH